MIPVFVCFSPVSCWHAGNGQSRKRQRTLHTKTSTRAAGEAPYEPSGRSQYLGIRDGAGNSFGPMSFELGSVDGMLAEAAPDMYMMETMAEILLPDRASLPESSQP